MAEYVQQNIEDMLPELEQLERVGLFTKDETRQILKKRQGYEYRLRRQTKCKEDFLQYIQYEINCLALLHKRREKTGYSFKQLNLENVIKERINKLFRMATYRFQEDLKLWMSHIAFCESKDDVVRVGKIFTRMLQVHNKKPEIWILAAKWEFENKNAENARATLQRGLRFNPDSKKLWLEYYRMELLYTDKMQKRKKILGVEDPEMEGKKDAVLTGQVAEVVYKQAKEAFPDDAELILGFIQICELFSFTKSQLDSMYKDLKKNYPDKPLTWDARARRCMSIQTGQDSSNEDKMHSVYEKAVSQINTSKIFIIFYIYSHINNIQLNKNIQQKQNTEHLLNEENPTNSSC
ncbi:hypothetical protein SNE40_020425 [Patella caerulea]|uniref:U3 small nucleolar RNA-associated protein 6 N-terminal domain-containing protein n=1 Tax=Patella caerulea TaxID=87958 RepID=A0AAN8J0A9_PATCE